MTIRTFEVYELRCDCCQRPATELHGAPDRPTLIRVATTRGWTLHANHHHCPTCSQPHHTPKDHHP